MKRQTNCDYNDDNEEQECMAPKKRARQTVDLGDLLLLFFNTYMPTKCFNILFQYLGMFAKDYCIFHFVISDKSLCFIRSKFMSIFYCPS